MARLVVSDKPSFVGGSVVPAGTPFEVPEDAKLEAGTVEWRSKAAAEQKAPQAPQVPTPTSMSGINAQGGVLGDLAPAGKPAATKAPARGKAKA